MHIPSSAGPAPVPLAPSPAPAAVMEGDAGGGPPTTASDSGLPARLRGIASTALGILSPDRDVLVEAADELEYLREVVDALAAAQMDCPEPPEIDEVMAVIHANSAVVDAAQVECRAEAALVQITTRALTAPAGSVLLADADQARSTANEARDIRRAAVTRLNELEARS